MNPNTRRRVERIISEYCARRVPAEQREDIRPGFRIRGNSVTLFDEERSFLDKSTWVEIAVAQFRFDVKSSYWTLYWPDRNIRWHPFPVVVPSRRLEDLIEAVKGNPLGAFQLW
jgi:Protein of unknown function (DUF3024)